MADGIWIDGRFVSESTLINTIAGLEASLEEVTQERNAWKQMSGEIGAKYTQLLIHLASMEEEEITQ